MTEQNNPVPPSKSVYIGKNSPKSSMYLVGQQLSTALNCPLTSKIAELKGVEDVITIVVDEIPKLLTSKRFVGFRNLHVFFAPNVEEFSDADMVGLLIHVCTGDIKTLTVHSHHTYSKFESLWLRYLSPKLFAHLKQHVKVCLWGISSEFKFRPENRNPSKFIAPFNRIQGTQKNATLHAELSALIKSKGAETIMIHGGFMGGEPPDIYTIIPQGTRTDYLQTIEDVGLSVCTSNYESFGIYYLELIASGIPVLFLDKPWVRKLMPSYPLIFELKELEAALTQYESLYPTFVNALKGYVSTQEWANFQWHSIQQRIQENYNHATSKGKQG